MAPQNGITDREHPITWSTNGGLASDVRLACEYSEHVRGEDETLTVSGISLRCNKWSKLTNEIMRGVLLEMSGTQPIPD
jgi:hypothetical protein